MHCGAADRRAAPPTAHDTTCQPARQKVVSDLPRTTQRAAQRVANISVQLLTNITIYGLRSPAKNKLLSGRIFRPRGSGNTIRVLGTGSGFWRHNTDLSARRAGRVARSSRPAYCDACDWSGRGPPSGNWRRRAGRQGARPQSWPSTSTRLRILAHAGKRTGSPARSEARCGPPVPLRRCPGGFDLGWPTHAVGWTSPSTRLTRAGNNASVRIG